MKPDRVSRIVLWMLVLALTAAAQRYNFAAYGQAEGLDNLNVNAVVQDRAGFIWVGTEGGLYRLEGGHFRAFGAADGLANDFIYSLHLDPGGRLWAGTDDGLFVTAAAAAAPVPRFVAVPGASPNSVAPDSAFADAGGGQLLVVAGSRLLEVDERAPPDQWRARDYFSLHPLPALASAWPVRSVLATADGAIWFGCGDGLCRIAHGRGSRWGPDQGLPRGGWLELLQARDGTLWARGAFHVAALASGAARFEDREAGLPPVRASDGYYQFLQDASGRILTPMAQGLAVWTPGASAWSRIGPAQGLSPFTVTTVAQDRQGRVWMGAAGHGLTRWLGYDAWQSWTAADGLASTSIWSLLPTTPHTVWVASEQGVDQIDPTSGAVRPFTRLGADGRQAVRFLRQSTDGDVWFVNRSGLVMDYDARTQALVRYPRLLGGGIRDAFADRHNRFWIAASNGLFLADRGRHAWAAVHDPAFDTNSFYTVAESPAGELWCSGLTGLFQNVAGHWRKIALPASGLDPRFVLLVPEDDGSVWVSDYRYALDRLWIAGGRLTRFERINPPTVASNEIVFMEPDRRGWLWVGTDHGADIFDGRRWRRVDVESGLLWNDLDDHAFAAAADGTVWIGTSAGVAHLTAPATVFAPENLRARLTALSLGGRDLLAGGGQPTPWNRGALEAQFTALGAPSPRGLLYRYRLRGFEDDWAATAVGAARYAQLPPGHYTFEVMAEDLAQHATSPELDFALVVTPPWWRSVWFEAMLACLAFLAAFRFWRWRERVLLARQHALERQVAERTRELEAEKHELEIARQALQVQATRDGLTQLWNRGAILARLSEELDRAQRAQVPVAAVLVDLDHFKSVNDRFGHLRGDRVLCEAARRFESAARAYDGVGRYGGEEFLIVLPGLAPAEAPARLEQFRQIITGSPFLVDTAELRLTCSFGVAWAHPGQSIEELLDYADRALYIAKTEGRDRIAYAGPPPR